jgi:hypothetical protein
MLRIGNLTEEESYVLSSIELGTSGGRLCGQPTSLIQLDLFF